MSEKQKAASVYQIYVDPKMLKGALKKEEKRPIGYAYDPETKERLNVWLATDKTTQDPKWVGKNEETGKPTHFALNIVVAKNHTADSGATPEGDFSDVDLSSTEAAVAANPI